ARIFSISRSPRVPARQARPPVRRQDGEGGRAPPPGVPVRRAVSPSRSGTGLRRAPRAAGALPLVNSAGVTDIGMNAPEDPETKGFVASRRAVLALGAVAASTVVTVRPALAQAAGSILACQIPVPGP